MGSACTTPRIVPSEPDGEPGSAWTQWEDGDGNIYYYNFRSGNYTYEPKQCDWYEMRDEHDQSYWMNVATGETSWNGPCQPPEALALQNVIEQAIGQMHVALPTSQAVPAPAAAPMATAVEIVEQALV